MPFVIGIRRVGFIIAGCYSFVLRPSKHAQKSRGGGGGEGIREKGRSDVFVWAEVDLRK